MIVILNDQLFQLDDTVLMCIRILVHHADKRNLCPHYKSHLIAGIIKILRMLIMCQTNRVCPQLLDEPCIFVMILFCKSISFIEHILMAAHSAQRSFCPIDDKAFVRITGKTAHTHTCGNLIIRFISSLQLRSYCIQVRSINLPEFCIRNIHCYCSFISRAAGTCHFISLCITDSVQYGKVFICLFHIRNNLKCSASTFTRFWCYLNSRSSVILQIKMRIRNTDQISPSVQPAIKCKVCRLRIHTVFHFIAACNDQKIVPFFVTHICNVRTECRISAFVICHFFSIYIHGCLLTCCQNFYIDLSAS